MREGRGKLKSCNFKDALVSLARALLYILIFLFVPSLVSTLVTSLVGVLNSGMPKQELVAIVQKLTSPIMIASYGVTILVFTIMFKCQKTSLIKKAEINPIRPRLIIDGALLGVGMYGVFQGIIILLGFVLPDGWLELQSQQAQSLLGGSFVFGIIYTVLVAPLCEEIVFRGLILGALKGNMPRIAAILLSALAFSLIHLPSPIALGYTFVLGLILGFVFYYTKSLLPCILAHTLFNATNYLLFIPKNIGLYIVLAISIPFVIYSVIDILKRGKQ